MKFRPLHDRVVVKRIEAEEKSVGGIIIPDTAKEKPSQGEVIAVGPGGRDEAGKLIPIDIKEGDRVLFGKWSGTEVKIDGQELLIMKESDIMGHHRRAGLTTASPGSESEEDRNDRPPPLGRNSNAEIASCFQQLTNVDNGVFDRLSRYETTRGARSTTFFSYSSCCVDGAEARFGVAGRGVSNHVLDDSH